ncbi:MAG: hypothetical protein RIT81_43140 [Deltaproteobacteria bacterium]
MASALIACSGGATPRDGGTTRDVGTGAGRDAGADGGRDDAGIERDAGAAQDGGPHDAGAVDGGARDGGAEDGGARDGGDFYDGGAPRDGGVFSDGGPLRDGGFVFDGGPLRDGGFVYDGGPLRDGGFVYDGGPLRDGGFVYDGGPLRDGGFVYDGGPLRDGGFAYDGGPLRDGGFVFDGGPLRDGGFVFDGGGVPDAGHGPDAGVAPDAGFCATPSAPYPVGFYEGTVEQRWCTTSALYNCVPDANCTTTSYAGGIEVSQVSSSGALRVRVAPLTNAYYGEASRTTTGTQLDLTLISLDCLPIPFSTGFGDAQFEGTTQQATAHVECIENGGFGCGSVPELHDIRDVEARYRCAPGATVCVRGSIVTCDFSGTVTASVSCGAPCAP